MPVLIVTLVLAVLLGQFAPRRIAVSVTAAAALFNATVWVWAAADGKGTDPWWFALVGVAGSALAMFVCLGLSGRRLHIKAIV